MQCSVSLIPKLFVILLVGLVLAGAVPIPPSSNADESEDRRRGRCLKFFLPRTPRAVQSESVKPPDPFAQSQNAKSSDTAAPKTVKYANKGAIVWTTRPVIIDGYLVASGRVIEGSSELLNPPDSGIATFALKKRGTNFTVATIVKPLGPNKRYTGSTSRLVATEWHLTSREFSIKAPMFTIRSPVDLLVWGNQPGSGGPLSIHPVKTAEE